MVPLGGNRRAGRGKPGEAGDIEVPVPATGPNRPQQALHQGEKRPDQGAEEEHQSAA